MPPSRVRLLARRPPRSALMPRVRVRRIPDVPGNVKHLDANGNRITTLGDSLKSGTNLEVLEVYNNQIKTIGAGVLPALTNLNTLNLFNNKMMKLPADIGQLTNLEEVNISANKLMMLTDDHFAGWASVKILNLYDNNLIRLGSLAPLVALEELRLYGNQLEAMPTLGKQEKLTIVEIHKNRIKDM
jgi:Leucine-rich repeat (LRR) protein